MADASPAVSKPSPVRMADAIRVLAMDAVEKAKSGHPGLPMGTADIATALRPAHPARARPASELCKP